MFSAGLKYIMLSKNELNTSNVYVKENVSNHLNYVFNLGVYLRIPFLKIGLSSSLISPFKREKEVGFINNYITTIIPLYRFIDGDHKYSYRLN